MEKQSKKRKFEEINQPSIKTFFSQHSSQDVSPPPSKRIRKNSEEEKSPSLKELLEFKPEDMKSIEDYEGLFARIAHSMMNEHLLVVNTDYRYRICECEFYLNDVDAAKVHPDTFAHGDEMQRLSGQWYFHRFGKTFKSGTYKGLDLTFGKGKQAVGGILIRSIMSVGALNGKHLPPKDFVEGPCNSVTRILKHNSPSDKDITEVKDFVVLPGFSTDALAPTSNLLSLKAIREHTDEELKLLSNDIPTTLYRGPRVGLTLKRFDEHKCRFWMSDYRFVTQPHLNKK
jgi:hypothetical protein